MTDNYEPVGPVFFQTGKRKGKSLDAMMFNDLPFLVWWLNVNESTLGNGTPNITHLHLRWLMMKAKNTSPTAICRFCKKNTISFFSVRTSTYKSAKSIGIDYTCCENTKCKENLDSIAASTKIPLYGLDFNNVINFIKRSGRFSAEETKDLANLLRKAYEVPTPLRASVAFNFFNTIP